MGFFGSERGVTESSVASRSQSEDDSRVQLPGQWLRQALTAFACMCSIRVVSVSVPLERGTVFVDWG